MDAKIHSGNVKTLKRDKMIAISIAVGMALSNIMLVYFLYGKDTKVVISPPTVKHEYTISENTADPVYFQEMGLYFAVLIGNLSDSNVDFVMKVMKRHMTRKLNRDVKAALFDQITAIKENNMETAFEPNNVTSISTDRVLIQGTRITYMNNEPTERLEMSYEFKFKVKNWFLYIADFNTRTDDK